MKKFLISAIFLLFGCLLANNVLAAEKCNDPLSRWNVAVDNNPPFQCSKEINYGDSKNKITYTFIVPQSYTCEHVSGCAGGKCSCVRLEDCDALYRSEGFTCIDFSDKKNKKEDYECRPFHCRGYNDFVCCRLKLQCKGEACSAPELPTQTATTTPVTIEPPITIDWSLGGCCQQIVPPIDHRLYDYGLNHLVQVAINIYKCILCIIGSLMLLMTVLGGANMILAAGNKPRIESGKKMIVAAVVGGIIVLSSVLLINFFVKAFGASFISEEKLDINPGSGAAIDSVVGGQRGDK